MFIKTIIIKLINKNYYKHRKKTKKIANFQKRTALNLKMNLFLN